MPKYLTVEGNTYDTIEEVLAEHDKDEELHAFYSAFSVHGNSPFCSVCGDTEEGLMHNNTERNAEPLIVDVIFESTSQDELDWHARMAEFF